MSQRPRLSTIACEEAEQALSSAADTRAYLTYALRDGVIDPHEAGHLTTLVHATELEIQDAVVVCADVDEAIAISVGIQRTGLDSPRVTRLQGERRMRLLAMPGVNDPLEAA